ncbi:hypothetical protein ACOACO_16405 [Nocardioides sp. CPCC 205120]|uniref:hypothetical protein n=1 Tax=Nocardioides sp. CPCC 205120 TaxID=3406462 RepID=UPI003B5102C2
MPDENTQTTPRLDLDWVKLVAGALAAVSSAFLLSTLGAVGTLLGAALGSVIASVSASLYSASLERSRQKVLAVQVPLRRREPGDPDSTLVLDVPAQDVAAGDPPGPPADETARVQRVGDGGPDGADATDGASDGAGDPAGGARRSLLSSLPWRRVGLWAAGLFLAALLVLTVIELVVGRSASQITGGSDGSSGTSLSQLGGGSSSQDEDQDDPAPGAPGTREPSGTSTSEPTSDSSDQPSEDPTSTSTSDEPTSEPTATGSATGAPSATAPPTRPAVPSAPATGG